MIIKYKISKYLKYIQILFKHVYFNNYIKFDIN